MPYGSKILNLDFLLLFCFRGNNTRSEAEFFMSIYRMSKFICSLDVGVPRLLITEKGNFSKSIIYNNRILYAFEIEFIVNAY